MSSFNAEMMIKGHTFKLLDVNFAWFQHRDSMGKPIGEAKGGTFTIQIETSAGPQFEMLTEWMMSNKTMHNGVIRFYKEDGISRLYDFEFYDTHCISYRDVFSSTDSLPMITTLTLSAGVTRIRGLLEEKKWKVSDLGYQV